MTSGEHQMARMGESSGAETLRDAARLMRERATGATPGPWEHTYGGIYTGAEAERIGIRYDAQVVDDDDLNFAEDDAEHIASWHPDVALAVADLLETAPDTGTSSITYHAALSVARAYLGESA